MAHRGLWRVRRAAEFLDVSEATVRRHVPTKRIGGCLRVDPYDLARLLDSDAA